MRNNTFLLLIFILKSLSFSYLSDAFYKNSLFYFSLPVQYSMANTGITTAHPENAVYFNPAILSISDSNVTYLSLQFSSLTFYFPDIKHFSSCVIPKKSKIGGFSLAYDNRIYKYEVYVVDIGVVGVEKNSYNMLHLGYGYKIPFLKYGHHGIGVNFNYGWNIFSGASPSNRYSIDIGYLTIFPFGLRVGFSASNILQFGYYEGEVKETRLPRTFNFGIGYINEYINPRNIKAFSFLSEIKYDLRVEKQIKDFIGEYEIVKEYYNLMSIGLETRFLNTFSFRTGFCNKMFLNPFNKWQFGTGLSFFNHFNIDIHFFKEQLLNPDYNPNYEGKVAVYLQFAITINNLLNWKKSDLRWIKKI